jgi:hypothetical protein
MTEYILYAWGFYYFIVRIKGLPTYRNNYKWDIKQLKATWVNCLKGLGLMLCGKIIAVFLNNLNRYDISKGKVDMFLATPLIIFSIIKIAKLLNKRDKTRENES